MLALYSISVRPRLEKLRVLILLRDLKSALRDLRACWRSMDYFISEYHCLLMWYFLLHPVLISIQIPRFCVFVLLILNALNWARICNISCHSWENLRESSFITVFREISLFIGVCLKGFSFEKSIESRMHFILLTLSRIGVLWGRGSVCIWDWHWEGSLFFKESYTINCISFSNNLWVLLICS